MSKHLLPLLMVVFALWSGACAGRQAQTGLLPRTTSFQAQRSQEPVAAAAPADVPAPTAQVEPATVAPTVTVEVPAAPAAVQLTDAELRQKVQQEIQAYVHGLLDEADAANRAAAEKLHRTYVTPSLPNNDELVAALQIDYERFQHMSQEADRQFYASVKEIVDKAYARERVERQRIAATRAVHRRVSAAPHPSNVVAAVTAAPPQSEDLPAASAAPSVDPTPAPAKTVALAATLSPAPTRSLQPQPAAALVPDAGSVAMANEHERILIKGTLFAVFLGLLLAAFFIWRRSKDLRALSEPYADLPDGAVVIQLIQGGKVHQTNVVMNGTASPPPVIDTIAADAAEQKFFADAANQEVDALLAEITPSPQPPAAAAPPDPSPVPATGTGEISSQGRANHAVAGEIDKTAKAVTEKPEPVKNDGLQDDDDPVITIIFDDKSDDPATQRSTHPGIN